MIILSLLMTVICLRRIRARRMIGGSLVYLVSAMTNRAGKSRDEMHSSASPEG